MANGEGQPGRGGRYRGAPEPAPTSPEEIRNKTLYEEAKAAGTLPIVPRQGRYGEHLQRESEFTAQRVADAQDEYAGRRMGGAYNPAIGVANMGIAEGFTPSEGQPLPPWYSTKSATDPFDLTQGNIAADMTPEELKEYSDMADFVRMFDGDPSQTDYGQGGAQTDPFDWGLGGQGDGGGGGGDYGVGSAYENYFANQEQYAQEKFDSISGYLDELQISSDAGFAADMERISGMYDERRESRNQRFADALNRAGGRESAAIDTLAELGIQADANTFDSVTGETRDMLFSQQMSGADLLNSMSYITDTIYDFAKNEQDLSIGAGLENAQQNLLAEMSAIQMARDSKAISDAEAAQAAASAAAEAQNLQQYYITMGASIGMSPEVSVAYGELGYLGDAYDTAMEPGPEEQFNVDLGLGFGGMPMTMDQMIKAGAFVPDEIPEEAEGGISFLMGGQPVTLPYNANFQDIMLFAQQMGIDIEPIGIPGQ